MDVQDVNFADRVKRRLAKKQQHAARASRAVAKYQSRQQHLRAIEKIRSIARSGSSSFAPHLASPVPAASEYPDERPIVVDPIEAIKDQQQRAITSELTKQRYRLSWRVAQRLSMDETIVQAVMKGVTALVPQIDKEKRLMERWIREIFAGKIEKVRRDNRGDNVRHDSRVRHRRGNIDRRGMVVEL